MCRSVVLKHFQITDAQFDMNLALDPHLKILYARNPNKRVVLLKSVFTFFPQNLQIASVYDVLQRYRSVIFKQCKV